MDCSHTLGERRWSHDQSHDPAGVEGWQMGLPCGSTSSCGHSSQISTAVKEYIDAAVEVKLKKSPFFYVVVFFYIPILLLPLFVYFSVYIYLY